MGEGGGSQKAPLLPDDQMVDGPRDLNPPHHRRRDHLQNLVVDDALAPLGAVVSREEELKYHFLHREKEKEDNKRRRTSAAPPPSGSAETSSPPNSPEVEVGFGRSGGDGAFGGAGGSSSNKPPAPVPRCVLNCQFVWGTGGSVCEKKGTTRISQMRIPRDSSDGTHPRAPRLPPVKEGPRMSSPSPKIFDFCVSTRPHREGAR